MVMELIRANRYEYSQNGILVSKAFELFPADLLSQSLRTTAPRHSPGSKPSNILVTSDGQGKRLDFGMPGLLG